MLTVILGIPQDIKTTKSMLITYCAPKGNLKPYSYLTYSFYGLLIDLKLVCCEYVKAAWQITAASVSHSILFVLFTRRHYLLNM